MLRRWIIRGLGIALLTLCATAWVGSHWRLGWISYHQIHNDSVWVNCGSIRFNRLPVFYETPGEWEFETASVKGWSEPARAFDFRFLGFSFFHIDRIWDFEIPLWFPTTLSAGFLWLVWRKTRPKYNGKGFPVELAAKPTEP